MFEVLMNGVGDAFSVRHWGTNFLCRAGDFVLAVDCPDAYRRALKANAFDHGDGTLDAEHIDALFLTHLHGDHVNGLEMLLAYRKFAAGGPLQLWTTPDVADVLWENRLAVSLGTMFDGTNYNAMHFEDYAELRIVPWGAPMSVGPFQLETRRTVHHIPTAGLRITHDGATLGYSCDTAWDPDHFAWLRDADLIVHETSFGPAHTPLHQLVAQPADVRAKLLIAHYPDSVTEPEELTFAREGSVYEVGSTA